MTSTSSENNYAVANDDATTCAAVKPALSPPSTVAPAKVSSLDLLRWDDRAPTLQNVRVSATHDSSAFINASIESHVQKDFPTASRSFRSNHPLAGDINDVSNLTIEQAEPLQKRRSGSNYKRREMTGSGIFDSQPSTDLPTASLLAFETDELTSIRKPAVSVTEAAKQRELTGTIKEENKSSILRRPCSSAKSRELGGNDIFGKSMSGPSSKETEQDVPRTSVRVSHPAGGHSQITFGVEEGTGGSLVEHQHPHYQHQHHQIQSDHGPELERGRRPGHNKKLADLSGSKIFDEVQPLSSERLVSAAKRREMLGNNIFSLNVEPYIRHSGGRVRQPPGGDSNLKIL